MEMDENGIVQYAELVKGDEFTEEYFFKNFG